MKRNGHFAISVIDNWGMHSDENNKLGAILSSNTVCVGSPVIIMLQKIN